jgi:hypothetical protein
VLYTGVSEKGSAACAYTYLARQKKRGKVSPALIDSFVFADIPDPVEDPLDYALVAEFMMPGPCGEDQTLGDNRSRWPTSSPPHELGCALICCNLNCNGPPRRRVTLNPVQ